MTTSEWVQTWMKTYILGYRAESTYRGYYAAWRLLCRYFPDTMDMPVDQMTELIAQNVLANLAHKGYSYSQLNTVRVVFHQTFQKAADNGLCERNPIQHLEIPSEAPKGHRTALTRTQQQAVLEAASHIYLGHIAIFMMETGLRRSEVRHLQWPDFSLARQTIHIRHSKTNAGERYVPLTRLALQILLSEPKKKSDLYIFHNKIGNPINDTNLRRLYIRLRKETGIQDITNHVFRHTFATRAVEDDMNIKALSMILGHTDVAFTMRTYAHPDEDFLRSQMQAFDRAEHRRS